MGATTWSPMTRFEPRSWLLANGETVFEPALEQTSSGRKVRVAGTTESVYAGELDQLLERAAEEAAKQRGTHVWLEGSKQDFMQGNLSKSGAKRDRATLHLLGGNEQTTQCWWRFKDPNSLYEVLLVLLIETKGSAHRVNAYFCHPYRAWEQSWAGWQARHETFRDWADMLGPVTSYTDRQDYWYEFCRDNDPAWPDLPYQMHATPRQAVKAALEKVREFEDLASIKMPALFDVYGEARHVELEAYESNVSAEFISELTEYLDGAPTVERALELYTELLQAMKSAGIQVGDRKSENDFLAALMSGDRKSLNIPVSHLSEEGIESRDGNHRLTVHLPTGTFIVECDHREVDRNKVAEKWEEARTMASLTGSEDELLAYAKAYAKDKIKGRTERILQERTT